MSDTRPETGQTSALVTGASSGIGTALARLLASKGHDLVITARRESRLQELKAELEAGHGVRVEIFVGDLSDTGCPARLYQAIEDLGLQIDILINNAGYGLPGDFHDSEWSEHLASIQVLATAPTELMYYFLPGMKQRGWGRVLNVASIGAYFPGSPRMTLYAALKHYLLVTSQTLAEELKGTGVTVTALCPGPTESEWAENSGSDGIFRKLPKSSILSADQVAELAYAGMLAGRRNIVTGAGTKIIAQLLKVLPAGIPLGLLSSSYSD